MLSKLSVTIALVVILFLISRHESYVASRSDGRSYQVLSGFADRQDAADRLAEINRKNLELIEYLFNKYQDPGTLGYTMATRLKKRYRPNSLVENDPPDKDNTSFTEDKGALVALCLREKVTGENHLHDQNTLEFVDLHELAHIASVGYGHEKEFWSNFAFLLHEAYAAGIHTPRDYSKNPVNYCGLDVSYNPFYNGI